MDADENHDEGAECCHCGSMRHPLRQVRARRFEGSVFECRDTRGCRERALADDEDRDDADDEDRDETQTQCALCDELHACWTMEPFAGLPRGDMVCEWCFDVLSAEQAQDDAEREWERRHGHDEPRRM